MQQTPKRERTRRLAGFTLVELMVSLLIVGIVMMGWWRIMNATSPYREAQRRAAVEVAAGVLDVLEPEIVLGRIVVDLDETRLCKSDNSTKCHPFPTEWFPPESPIRYTLEVEQGTGVFDWKIGESSHSLRSRWMIIKLYDSEDLYRQHKPPFAVLRQLFYTIRI